MSAKESFLYNHGEYLTSADYVRKKSRWSLVYSNGWGIARNKPKVDNQYRFANGNMLAQNSETEYWKNKNIANALSLRYTNVGEKCICSWHILGHPYTIRKQIKAYRIHWNIATVVHDTKCI